MPSLVPANSWVARPAKAPMAAAPSHPAHRRTCSKPEARSQENRGKGVSPLWKPTLGWRFGSADAESSNERDQSEKQKRPAERNDERHLIVEPPAQEDCSEDQAEGG